MHVLQAAGKGGKDKLSAQQATAASDESAKSDAPLPAESPALQKPEVNADNGGTEFDADAADVQTPVGAQG